MLADDYSDHKCRTRVFESHKRFIKSREEVEDNERYGRATTDTEYLMLH